MTGLPNPRPSSAMGRFMVGASARLNYEWARLRPGQPPFFILTEFPRSGGNWIRDVLADALQLPAPRFPRLPITFKSIIHNHDHRLTDHPTIYVIRDPRDIFVSHFHQTARIIFEGAPDIKQKTLSRHPSLEGITNSTNALRERGKAFYHEWKNRSVGARVGWQDHVRPFLETQSDNLTLIRYEDMHTTSKETLGKVLPRLSDHDIPESVIEFAVARNSFASQTGRQDGKAQNTSTKRRGIIGSWRDELDPEVARVIAVDMQREMDLAGYD